MFRSLKARAAAGFVVVLSSGMLLGIASPASAARDAGGKLCQKGGWKTLVRADQTGFKNQADCVTYAAHGGQYGAQCLDSTVSDNVDLLRSGSLGELGNAPGYYSTDGTCSEGLYHTFTILAAPDLSAAAVACGQLGLVVLADNLSTLGYPVPSDWWACT